MAPAGPDEQQLQQKPAKEAAAVLVNGELAEEVTGSAGTVDREAVSMSHAEIDEEGDSGETADASNMIT